MRKDFRYYMQTYAAQVPNKRGCLREIHPNTNIRDVQQGGDNKEVYTLIYSIGAEQYSTEQERIIVIHEPIDTDSALISLCSRRKKDIKEAMKRGLRQSLEEQGIELKAEIPDFSGSSTNENNKLRHRYADIAQKDLTRTIRVREAIRLGPQPILK